MDTSTIQIIVQHYNEFQDFVRDRQKTLEKINPELWGFKKYFDDFDIYDQKVTIHGEDSSCGCCSNPKSFQIPSEWLLLSESEFENNAQKFSETYQQYKKDNELKAAEAKKQKTKELELQQLAALRKKYPDSN